MKYCLMEIAYDDTFHGFQIQPNVRTVQGEILSALSPLGIKQIYGSSRTDSKVRSCSNIIEIHYDDCIKLCRIIDSIPGIIVRSYFISDNYIKLRGSLRKYYLYIHGEPLNGNLLEKTIEEFLKGDFSKFSKDANRKVLLESIEFQSGRLHTVFIFSGKSFSWNFVRISAENIIRKVKGEISDEEWHDLLSGKRRYRFKGHAENLILFKTEIDIPFKVYNSVKLHKLLTEEFVKNYWLLGLGFAPDDLMLVFQKLKFLQ